MDPNLIAGLVVLLLGTILFGLIHQRDQRRYDTDMARATADRDAARTERDKERAERERWWQAYVDESTAHLGTRTKMQDSIDALEIQVRELKSQVDDLTSQLALLGGGGHS